jgi:hypothetical protein
MIPSFVIPAERESARAGIQNRRANFSYYDSGSRIASPRKSAIADLRLFITELGQARVRLGFRDDT